MPFPSKPDHGASESTGLKEVRAFLDQSTILGLPKRLFAGVAGLVIGLIRIVPWYIAALVGAIAFCSLYAIHQDDPRAIDAWKRSFRRPIRWSGGLAARRRVVVLD